MKWAAVISSDDAHLLGGLRLRGGIEVCVQDQRIWLKGEVLDDATDLALRKLSGALRYTLTADGQLCPVGARVPTGMLPAEGWVILQQFLRPVAPLAALAGQLPAPAALRLVRTSQPRPANAMLVGVEAWAAYAAGAVEIRLRDLSFAVSRDGQVIVRGWPLPPIRGMLLTEEVGVALPCGYQWQPAIDAESVRAVFKAGPQDLVILWPDGVSALLDQQCFVAASRSAARLTAQEMADG